ncbi:protein pygopus [Anopheles bellator]|uniref:protein pygopus n=1 Tax=Anopheles bellator TaxID=139047 RepID=UPI0026488FD8|nr:protein pygopus [Anopheles bellator]
MSSKKPTVVDSWEEIDEDRLPGSISILKNTDNNSPPQKVVQSGGSNTTARQSTLPEMLEEELKPKMVARPMQILRRPQSDAGDGKSSAESKPKAQVKSLDQRQKEYAEARLRILGSAHDDGEETETKKTNPPANGYRTNASNNNTTSNSSSSSSGNVTKSGGCSTSGASLVPGGSANNNGANYRFHAPPYRQQQPASLGAFQASGVPPTAGGAMFFAPSPPLPLPHTPNHPAMHGAHPALHLPHHSFPHAPPHPYQQQQQHQQQQHFAQHLNSPQPPHMFVGASGRGGSSTGYYSKGAAYGEVNGAPMMSLLGHAPPGHHGAGPYVGGAAYGVGSPNGPVGGVKAGSSGPPNGGNQHLLRLPAGPDGSQGFNMRR